MEAEAGELRYDNLTCACPPSHSYRSPPRGYPSQGSKVGAGQSYENEIRSKKDAETPAREEITYVCAVIFVALGNLRLRASFSS